MRSLILLLCVPLVLAAVTPSAAATNRCTFLDDWCPGVVCFHDGHRWNCTYEPDPRDLLCNQIWCLDRLDVPDVMCNDVWCTVLP